MFCNIILVLFSNENVCYLGIIYVTVNFRDTQFDQLITHS